MHYRDNWQGTPYKAQLVTQDKSTALLYKKYLDEFGMVSSEVLISGPDDREGNEEVDEENMPAVQQFWKKMMAKHGSEGQYNKNVINAFQERRRNRKSSSSWTSCLPGSTLRGTPSST